MTKHKERVGVVYSTDPNFQYTHKEDTIPPPADTLPPAKQPLRVQLSTKHRAGKQVTLITGFVGQESDLEVLTKALKNHCGTGGSVKDGEAIIQGDQRDRVMAYLSGAGYARAKRSGG